MALKIKRTSPFKTRIMSTMLMIFALMVQPLVALNVPAAFAIDSPGATSPITNVDAYYASGTGYTGIGVDFTVKNVSNVTGVKLSLDGYSEEYSIEGQTPLFSSINAGAASGEYTTSGTVIVTGSRTSSSESWETMTGTWAGSSRPTAATVTITLADSTVLTLSDNTIVDNGGNTQATVFAGVPATLAPVHNTNSGEYFDTIQEAIDDTDTDAGDTIVVAAGDYNGNTNITKSVTIEGAQAGVDARNTRGGESTINGTLTIKSDNVTVDGFTITSKVVSNFSTSPVSGTVVRNNIFNTSAGALDFNSSNTTITKNQFNRTGQYSINFSNQPWNGITISNNSFAGSGWYDINFIGAKSYEQPSVMNKNVVVSGNTSTSSGNFIMSTYVDGLTVTGNDINKSGNMVTLGGGNTNVEVSSNIFNGSGTAVRTYQYVDSGHPTWPAWNPNGKVVVHSNQILSSNGVNVAEGSVTELPVDATGNWWGDAGGPTDTVSGDGSVLETNPGATGAKAVGAVKYIDWCKDDSCVTPEIHSVRFSTMSKDSGSAYDGIVIDSYMKGFTDAKSIKVEIERADGSKVSRRGNHLTRNHINQGGNHALTTPFSFEGNTGDAWWNPQDALWTEDTKPVRVTITVNTTSHGKIKFSTDISQELVETNGTYHSLYKVAAPDVNSVVLNGQTVNMGDVRYDNCEPVRNAYLISDKIDLNATITDSSDVNRVFYKLRKVTDNGCTHGGSDRVRMHNSGSDVWAENADAILDTNNVNSGALSGELNGQYTLMIVSRDSVGNQSVTYVDVQIDNVNPVVSDLSLSSDLVKAGSNPTLTAKADGTGSDVASAQYRILDSNKQNMSGWGWVDIDATDGTYDDELEGITSVVETTGLADGTYTIRVRAFDAAGNKKSGNDISFEVDNNAPEVEILGATLVAENEIEFTGTVFDENLSHYYCWLTGTTGGEIGVRGENCVTTWASDLQRNGNPATSLVTGTDDEELLGQIDITGLADGDYIIHVGAKDRAGNLNTQEAFAITVDRSLFKEDVVVTPDTGGDTLTGGGESIAERSFEDVSALSTLGLLGGDTLGLLNQGSNPVDELQDNAPDTNSNEDAESAVAGEQDENGTPLEDTGEIAGVMDHKFLGIAWYWYVIALAALIGGWLFTAAAIRRRRAEA